MNIRLPGATASVSPVESHKTGGYCQILKMEDEWWMYYNAIPRGEFNYDSSRKDGSGYMVCLATSKDGLKWQRKDIDLYNVKGETRNNVVIPNAYGNLLVDPNETNGYRYWFLAHMEECSAWGEAQGCKYHSGLYLLKSKDGIIVVRFPIELHTIEVTSGLERRRAVRPAVGMDAPCNGPKPFPRRNLHSPSRDSYIAPCSYFKRRLDIS